MNKPELMKIPLKYFGIPELRKYPMHDEEHLKAAIAYFYAAKPQYREELAKNIIKRYNELRSDIKITSKNPLYKYVPDNMKALTESSTEPLITNRVQTIMKTLSLFEVDTALVNMLKNSNNLHDIDDIDECIPDEYPNRDRIIAYLKSTITNNTYPVMYIDFPITSSKIKNVKDVEFSMLESEHDQFVYLLREWDEGYVKGYRSKKYDRLMIESWKMRVEELLESYRSCKSSESYQKLIDLGIHDMETAQDMGAIDTILDNIDSKVGELDIPTSVIAGDGVDNTISITTEIGQDGTEYSSIERSNDDYEEFL